MITVKSREEFLIECQANLSNLHPPYGPISFEIGVFRGDFSQLILDFINPVALMLVDPFKKSESSYGEGVGNLPTAYSTDDDFGYVSNRFKKYGNRVYIWRDYSYNIVKRIANNLDFVYHDASHLYEDLKRDLSDWLPLIVKHGIVAGHDYGNDLFPGVKKAVDEFLRRTQFLK